MDFMQICAGLGILVLIMKFDRIVTSGVHEYGAHSCHTLTPCHPVLVSLVKLGH